MPSASWHTLPDSVIPKCLLLPGDHTVVAAKAGPLVEGLSMIEGVGKVKFRDWSPMPVAAEGRREDSGRTYRDPGGH